MMSGHEDIKALRHTKKKIFVHPCLPATGFAPLGLSGKIEASYI
jgi:hypothetical protein